MNDDALSGELMARPDSDSPGVTVNGTPIAKQAGNGGAYEAASTLGRELGNWNPKISSADGALGRTDKLLLDGRGHDTLRNSGPMQGASETQKDSIVGSTYRLNSKPNIRVLGAGFDEKWADEFQQEVEAKYMLYAESPDKWIDASRMNTATGLIRLGIGCFFAGGELLATAEYMRGVLRPFATALQMVDCDRLCNPNDSEDTATLRRGIEKDRYGAPIAAHIRDGHPRDFRDFKFTWTRVPIRKPWGRIQVIHVLRQMRPDQTRGIAQMVAALKEHRMGKAFHEVSLQNAIVQASYAAAIESELPPEMAMDMIGANVSRADASMSLLEAIAAYSRGGRNLEIDGVKIPHLFPGSKLKLYPAGTVSNVGQNFESSLDRNISTALGLSYEEYTHDFTKTNYSGYRGAVNMTGRHMRSKKREVADTMANHMFALWMEEALSKGQIESLPARGRDKNFFYEGMNKDALCRATWIGASEGQVDELKETQAAILRITGGLSTYEAECARLGSDFREVFEQRAREEGIIKEKGLVFSSAAVKPGTLSNNRGSDSAANSDNADNTNNAAGIDDGFGD